MPGDDLLFTKQVADEYQLNYGTLRYWRCNDQGPASFTLGSSGASCVPPQRSRAVARRDGADHTSRW